MYKTFLIDNFMWVTKLIFSSTAKNTDWVFVWTELWGNMWMFISRRRDEKCRNILITKLWRKDAIWETQAWTRGYHSNPPKWNSAWRCTDLTGSRWSYSLSAVGKLSDYEHGLCTVSYICCGVISFWNTLFQFEAVDSVSVCCICQLCSHELDSAYMCPPYITSP